MTEKTQPTDAELDMLIDDVVGLDSTDEVFREFARAVLAKWGTPAPVGVEPVALLVRKNSWRDGQWEAAPPNSPSYGLGWANQRVYVYTAPQPIQPQAGAVPLTDEQWQRIADLTDSILTRATKDEIERVIGIKGGQHGAE